VGRIKKYGLVHEVLEAPRDEVTRESMMLEIYGRLTQVNGQPVGIGWYREQRPDDPASAEDAVNGELTFRLECTTSANTRWLGIGIPFCM
jgi:hypothetical protein